MFLPRPSMTGLMLRSSLTGEAAKSRRALGLLAATLAYLGAGAVLFSALEYEQDMSARADIAEKRQLMQDKYNFTDRDFALLERVVVQSIPFGAGHQWQFVGSLYFCTVVITTIGYGHSTPATRSGKLFCMAYALGGVPLGLVMFQSVGERINHFIGLALGCIGRWVKRHRYSDLLTQVKSRHLLCVSFAIGALTISVATGIFHQREHWSVFDSAYYCMITLTTIGLGDFVPAQTNGRLHTEPGYVVFTLFFILFGLAIFSACINLLILEFMARNADMVTARTRLKRAISARMTTSFRIVTGAGGWAGNAQPLTTAVPRQMPEMEGAVSVPKRRGLVRRGRAIRRRGKDAEPFGASGRRKTGVVVECIDDEITEQRVGSRRSHHRRRNHHRRNSKRRLQQQTRRSGLWPALLRALRRFPIAPDARPRRCFAVRRLPSAYIQHLVDGVGVEPNGHDQGRTKNTVKDCEWD